MNALLAFLFVFAFWIRQLQPVTGTAEAPMAPSRTNNAFSGTELSGDGLAEKVHGK